MPSPSAGADDRRLGAQERNGLALHVGAHQSPVRIVVFHKGDHRRGNRDHHLRGDVHQIHAVLFHHHDLVAVAAGDAVVEQAAVFVHRLVGLGDIEALLLVGGHIAAFGGNHAGFLIHDAVRRLDKAEVVDLGVGGEIGDQSDVRTFRRLDGAHAAVVAVVHVADFEVRAVAGQTAGTEGGKPSLVGQLGQGVGLIHELRKRRGAEEFLDGGGDGTDVDQGLGRDHVQILDRHPLLDDPLHAREADAELILQELAHAAQTLVAQMVGVVGVADIVGQAVQIVDGGQDVVGDDVLRDQLVDPVPDHFLQGLFIPRGVAEDGFQHREVDLFVDADRLGIEVHESLQIHHVVGEHHHVVTFHVQKDAGNAAAFQEIGPLAGQGLSRFGDQLAGHGIHHRQRQRASRDAGAQSQLFVVFESSHAGDVVALGVEEEAVEQRTRAFHRGRLARAETAVNFHQRFAFGLGGILFQGGEHPLVFPVKLADLGVGLHAESADQRGHQKLAVFVDADVEEVVGVGLILQPGASVRDNGGGIDILVGLVGLGGEVDAGRTDQLGDDDAFRSVDDEGPRVRHDRQVAHVELLLLDLLGVSVAQTHLDLDGSGVGGIAFLAFLHRVFRLVVHRVVDEGKLDGAGVIGDGGHVAENLPQTFVQEPLIGILLHLDEIRHLEEFADFGIAFSDGGAVLHVLNHASYPPLF